MRPWILLAVCFVLFVPATADAARGTSSASKAFWYWDKIDEVARDVSGFGDMHVSFDDDLNEWSTLFPYGSDSANILGFVDRYDPPLYHMIFVGPRVYGTIASYFTAGSATGNEYEFSVALMTLIHESFHWRLNSGDESTVNACALKWLGYYLIRDFDVPQTVEQLTAEDVPVTTVTRTPVVHVKIVQKRVKVKGKWVTRSKRVATTMYTTDTVVTSETRYVTTTVANPLYTLILADAAAFYAQQPPPYNAGTCSV